MPGREPKRIPIPRQRARIRLPPPFAPKRSPRPPGSLPCAASARGRFPEIEAQAIGDGWDATRCELEVLRSGRPKPPLPSSGPAIHMADHTVTSAVLQAACFLTSRLEDVEKACEAPALETASRRFRGGIGLQELLLEAAWANGYTGRNFRDSRSVLRFAFGGGGGFGSGARGAEGASIEAGLSAIDVGGILSNVANKFLLEGFFSVERTWRNICAVRNVNDFKAVTSYRLIGKDQYEQVAPGGELKHGSLGEEMYSNKADTYGLLLSIDRRDIINDDLGAITTVPRKLGPRLGPEDQRRLLGHLPQQRGRGVLRRRQQELPRGRRHHPVDRRAHEGRNCFHGPGRQRRQADRRDALDHARPHRPVGVGHAALQEPGDAGHHR